MTGIYKIQNLVTKDLYIGSCLDFNIRKSRHIRALFNNKHHSRFLQNAWNKYGYNQFIFEFLEECDKKNLIKKEQFYFEKLNPKYNMCPIAGRSTGYKHSKETLEKISKSQKGRKPSKLNIEINSKKVIMLDKETNLELMEFNSISEACRYCNKNHTFVSTISAVCNKKRKSAFGFKWKWK